MWLNIIFVAIIILCSAGVGTVMKADSSNELMVAVVSLGVALIALYISLRTFYSIDEVNAISRMDGNVMENPKYRPNILKAIFQFKQTAFTEASEALMTHMENCFDKKSKHSGARLSDSVQEVADAMVLVPFFIQTDDMQKSAVHMQRVASLINTMKKEVGEFREISDGSCKLLEETVSLIEAVFAFQKMTANGEPNPSKLLELRGSIFVNPVSVILYNNYLGLYFLQRATNVLCQHQKGLTLRQQINMATQCPASDKALAIMYASKAVKLFQKAKEHIGEDTIWQAFVCFNISRALYMLEVTEQDKNTGWEATIEESSRNWMTANLIIAEHFKIHSPQLQVTWLQQALISQENKVRLTIILFQMMRKRTLTDHNGNQWVERNEEIVNTPFFRNIPESDPQKRTDSLVADIRELLKTSRNV